MAVLRTVGHGVKLAGVSVYLLIYGLMIAAIVFGLAWGLLYQLGVLDSQF